MVHVPRRLGSEEAINLAMTHVVASYLLRKTISVKKKIHEKLDAYSVLYNDLIRGLFTTDTDSSMHMVSWFTKLFEFPASTCNSSLLLLDIFHDLPPSLPRLVIDVVPF